MTRTEHSVQLPPDVRSVRTGRHFARDTVLAWDLAQLADDVQLGVSELVTNAVRHAGTELTLSLRLDGALTVEVHDAEPKLRQPARAPQPDAGHGRGLRIVEAISTEWGVTADAGGKSVWFNLALPASDSADADVLSMNDHRDTLAAAQSASADPVLREHARGAH
jgi:anti-sigma regulatory factor (Ser/Thr protein kinase)